MMRELLEPYPLEGLDEKERRLILSIPAEAENTLEEFAWAFGDDTVAQIEKRVHHVLQGIHQLPDLERISGRRIGEAPGDLA